VDAVLIVLIVLWAQVLPFAVLLGPPIVMLACRRLAGSAALLYGIALALLVFWIVAMIAHMDWADRTGGGGSTFAGGQWLIAAAAAATASVVRTVRLGRRSTPAR
jgi:hypothetical protein